MDQYLSENGLKISPPPPPQLVIGFKVFSLAGETGEDCLNAICSMTSGHSGAELVHPYASRHIAIAVQLCSDVKWERLIMWLVTALSELTVLSFLCD